MVLGWNVRTRGDRNAAFDSGVGQVSGTWILGRKPFDETGLMIHIMVDDSEASMKLIGLRGQSCLS
jgi:uncharacterized protein